MSSIITFNFKGDFSKTTKSLKKMQKITLKNRLAKYGEKGVRLLSDATPRDTGVTAESWGYEIHGDKGSVSITWTNSSQNKGVSIVVLIQEGHGTRNGGYVQGRDFINPVMQPYFDEIADEVWKEVTMS